MKAGTILADSSPRTLSEDCCSSPIAPSVDGYRTGDVVAEFHIRPVNISSIPSSACQIWDFHTGCNLFFPE